MVQAQCMDLDEAATETTKKRTIPVIFDIADDNNTIDDITCF